MGTSSARALETLVAVLLVVRYPVSQPSFLYARLASYSFQQHKANSSFDTLCGFLIALLYYHSRDHWTPGLKMIAGLGVPESVVSFRHQQTSLNIPRYREIRAADLWSACLWLSTCSNRWTKLCWIMLCRLSMCYMSVLMTSYRFDVLLWNVLLQSMVVIWFWYAVSSSSSSCSWLLLTCCWNAPAASCV